jgi:hypothetical protein
VNHFITEVIAAFASSAAHTCRFSCWYYTALELESTAAHDSESSDDDER